MESVISGPNGVVRISRGFGALLRWAERRGRAAQSGALCCYRAFLQNAGVEGVGVPRAMLWAGMRCPVGTRVGGGEGWVVVGLGRRMDCIDGIDRIDGEDASGVL